MKSLLKYFYTFGCRLFFTILVHLLIQKCTQVKENITYLRKYFNPLFLESAVMYDDNGIILGSGTYAPWRQAIWKILGLPLLTYVEFDVGLDEFLRPEFACTHFTANLLSSS